MEGGDADFNFYHPSLQSFKDRRRAIKKVSFFVLFVFPLPLRLRQDRRDDVVRLTHGTRHHAAAAPHLRTPGRALHRHHLRGDGQPAAHDAHLTQGQLPVLREEGSGHEDRAHAAALNDTLQHVILASPLGHAHVLHDGEDREEAGVGHECRHALGVLDRRALRRRRTHNGLPALRLLSLANRGHLSALTSAQILQGDSS